MPAKRTESKTSKAPAAKKTAIIRRKKAAPAAITMSYEDIATRAYYLHLEGNHDAFENWIRAEHELTAATA